MSDLRFLEELGAEFRRVELQARTEASRRPGRRARATRGAREAIILGLAVLVIAGVAAVVLSARGRQPSGSAGHARRVTVVFGVSGVDQHVKVWPAAERATGILRLRLKTVFHGVKVARSGATVAVSVRGAPRASRQRILALAVPGHLAFYDWEQNVLLPDGQSVAWVLKTLPRGYSPKASITPSQRDAVAISERGGTPGAGSLSLYAAVKLAAKQPARVSTDPLHPAPQYYLFGAPGSAACKVAAKHYGYTLRPGQHCLLSGPDISVADLESSLPRGISPSQGQRLTVPPGTVVLQATSRQFSPLRNDSDPSARFYTLKDDVALSGNDITNPQPATSTGGLAVVTFGFTANGATKFRTLTARLTTRGRRLSNLGTQLGGPQLFQHFAVALDNQLISVPFINSQQYPNGLSGRHGADILGGLTTQSARTLATLLRFGPLVKLYPVK